MSNPHDVVADDLSTRSGKTGILLINLGTPDATSYWPMRRYLKEFLSDPRVVEANRALWWLILNGIILLKRPKKSGAAYDKIWNKGLDESPLRTITRNQSEKIAAHFTGDQAIIVDWAMRYGSPSIDSKIRHLKDSGCDRVLLFPLYPQYSSATTATALDKAYDALRSMRWQPAIRTVPPYFDHPGHIAALTESLNQHIGSLSWKPDVVLASFHGLPVEFHAKGDPYYCHCEKTVRLLREASGLDDDQLIMTFQSRPGRKKWLQPYTEDTIIKLRQDGVDNLLIITPGFSADCLETLEEIAMRGKELFLSNGGKSFSATACLNDSTGSIAMLATIIEEQIRGWR